MPLTAEDLKLRRNFIGASEAAALAGEDPFKQPIDIFLDKKGLTERTSSEAMDLGNALERPILDLFAARHGLEPGALIYPATMIHPSIPFIAATPDAIWPANDTNIQVKLVGPGMVRHWGDPEVDENPVPPWVVIQNQMEMLVAGLPHTITLALLGGTKLCEYRVERDPDFAAALVELITRFWHDHIEADVAPEVDASESAREFLQKRYPRSTRPMLGLTATAEGAARRYIEARDLAAKAEADKDLAGNQLRALIGDAEGFTGKGWKVTWSATKGRPSWKAIAEELGQKDLPALLAATVKHTTESTRTLRVYPPKGT